MSRTGKGVASTLALSITVTNLVASVFSEHRKLEPMATDTKECISKVLKVAMAINAHTGEPGVQRHVPHPKSRMC